MSRVHSRLIAALLAAVSTLAYAAIDNNWQGLNSSSSNTSRAITDPANWSEARVPTAGDRAVFQYTQGSGSIGAVVIPATDTTFAPDALTFSTSNANTGTLALNKSLDMTDLTLDAGSSITSGS